MLTIGEDIDVDDFRQLLHAVIARASTGQRAADEIRVMLRMLGPRSFGLLAERERDGLAWPFVIAEYRARVGCFSGDWSCELSAPGRFCVSAPMLNGVAFVDWVEVGSEARAS